MLPTFVIGLREGLEASLIVGIVAAFLRRNGRSRDIWALWVGVGIAIVLCALVAVGLRLAEQNLPQRQQEGLETIIGLVAVGFVTWMILWMRKHARDLKGDLESHAAAALAAGSATALIFMAFIAVLREGFETAVFLLAAFQASTDPASAGIGATLGVIVAVVIGFGIYKGGVKLNLAKFFTVTGVVLVVVAAGLCATAVHTAHEANWFNGLQTQAANLHWLVDPGSIRAALLTGMFGIQPRPTIGEAFAYIIYAVPMLLFVLIPARARRAPTQVAVPVA